MLGVTFLHFCNLSFLTWHITSFQPSRSYTNQKVTTLCLIYLQFKDDPLCECSKVSFALCYVVIRQKGWDPLANIG